MDMTPLHLAGAWRTGTAEPLSPQASVTASPVFPRQQWHGNSPAPAQASSLHDRAVSPMDVDPAPSLAPEPATTGTPRASRVPGQTRSERYAQLERLEQGAMRCIYGQEQVTDCALLDHMARRNLSLAVFPERIELTDRELAQHICNTRGSLTQRLLQNLPRETVQRLLAMPAIAEQALRQLPGFFYLIPEHMKTPETLQPLLDSLPDFERSNLLKWISVDAPDLFDRLVTLEQAVRIDPIDTCYRRADELTPALRQLAVEQNHQTIWYMRSVTDQEYGRLCDLALEQSGEALDYILAPWRTPERVDRALRHQSLPSFETIPAHLYTTERLKAALPNTTSTRLRCSFLTDWGLWDTLKTQPLWIASIPEDERTEELYREYVSRFPGDLSYIPASLLRKNPEWLLARTRSTVYLPLSEHQRVGPCYGLPPTQETPSVHSEINRQPWALALAPWDHQLTQLPQEYKEKILANGGTAGLADTLAAPPLHLEPEALLDPVQEHHCSLRAGALPDQARIQLMCAQSLPLRRPQEGQALLRKMDKEFLTLEKQLQDKALPGWQPQADAVWTRQGGRTLVHTDESGCVHMKFHRKDEPLDTFTAEKAAQDFALDHPELGWHSEIPVPQGMRLVRLEDLPVPSGQFPDPLEVYSYDGQDYALAFCFTTRDDSYDTPAWQPDAVHGRERAEKGLLKALHDIGIWSSMGAVHTSTIHLYHHFYESVDARPELLLSAFFNPKTGYPGTLHYWNSKAIQPSDWGYSGLRDLGDQELYPYITTYNESTDAEWMSIDISRRGSFVNAIAHNILGALLHYMRLHRDSNPDYHYKKNQSVTALAKFIKEGLDTLLDGLVGKDSRLEDFFPQDPNGTKNIFAEWLHLTAREMIYWTAPQKLGTDCFAEHLANDRRPSAELYPGHPRLQNVRYGSDYTEPEGESLGSENGKLPLFYLVRGLYLLAIGLVNPPQQPEPMIS